MTCGLLFLHKEDARQQRQGNGTPEFVNRERRFLSSMFFSPTLTETVSSKANLTFLNKNAPVLRVSVLIYSRAVIKSQTRMENNKNKLLPKVLNFALMR